MNRFSAAVCFLLLSSVLVGCGGSETTVIEPTETYELTATEKANRDLEEKMRAEEREQE